MVCIVDTTSPAGGASFVVEGAAMVAGWCWASYLAATAAVVVFALEAATAEVVLVCFSVRIMVLKSLSSLIRSRCFCMFSASLRTRLAIPESFPAYFCFRAKY